MFSPKRIPLLAVLWAILLGVASGAQAASVTLAWDPSNGASGYVVLWGTSSGVYGGQRDVGNVTQARIDALADGATYYFAVQAYGTTGLLSGPSSEVSATTPVPAGTTTTTNAPYLGFSGNGKPSLLMQNSSGALQLWALNGGTTASVLTPSPSSVASTASTTLQVMGAADFNSDGSPDILIQDTSTGQLTFWLMNGTQRMSAVASTPAGPPDANWKVVGIGDFNGDGKPDVVFQHKVNGSLLVWFMNGTAMQSASSTAPSGPADPQYKVVGVADVNGDRRPDLVFQHATTAVLCVWYMNGTGWTGASLLTPSAPADTRWRVIGAADMNGDQKPDVILQHSATGQVCFWYMNGATWYWAAAVTPVPAAGWRVAATDAPTGALTSASSGTTTPPPSTPPPPPPPSSTVTPVPSKGFGGDGRSSLVLQADDGALQAWFLSNSANATLQNLSPATVSDPTLQVVESADFDNDGWPDLLLQNSQTADLSIWYMNGTLRVSTATPSPSAPPDANWRVVGAGDFNADGKPDILFQHRVNGLLLVWFMNGSTMQSTTFTVPSGPTDPQYKVVGVADVNGDGKPDLVFQHETTAVLCVWFMNGTTWSSASLLTPSAPADVRWKMVGMADMNGDQRPDVVLQHSATGQICFWYMNGATWFWAAAVNPVPAAGWHVAVAR